MKILLALLLLPIGSYACGCFNSANACSDTREIVFVGRVLVDSGEGWGQRPARLQVEEILRGLRPEEKEVEVNSSFPRKPNEIRVRVTDEDGNPLEGVRVFLLNLQGVALLFKTNR